MSLLHLLGIIANMEGSFQRPLHNPPGHAPHTSLLDVTLLMERLVRVAAAAGHHRAEPVPAALRRPPERGLDPRLLLLARHVYTTRRWHEAPLTLDTSRGPDAVGPSRSSGGGGGGGRTTGCLRADAVLGAVGSLFPIDQSEEWYTRVMALPRGADVDAEVLVMLVQAVCWIAGRRSIQIQCPPVTLMGVYHVSLDVAVGCKSERVTHVPGADPRLLEGFCRCGAREAMAAFGGA